MDEENKKYERNGINKNTDKLLFDDNYHNETNEEILKNHYNLKVLEIYTRLREKRIFTKLLKIYYKKRYSIDFSKIVYNEEKKEYEYKDEFEGNTYTFNKLSNLLENKEIKNELESNKRDHKCHIKAVELISSLIPKGFIVTGYIKKSYGKFLHSVIEIERKNGAYIIDYTKNLVIAKEQYYKLTNFQEIERISEEQFFEDLLIIGQLTGLSLKEYLTFRSEMMRDLEKNKFLFIENKQAQHSIEILKKERQKLKEQLKKDDGR